MDVQQLVELTAVTAVAQKVPGGYRRGLPRRLGERLGAWHAQRHGM